MRGALLIIGLLMAGSLNAQLIISGDTCDNTPGHDYTYQNYTFGNHGYGINIFRDGVVVYNEEVIYSYVGIWGMHFPNDSVGFMIKVDNGIHKSTTSGTSWPYFCDFPGPVYGGGVNSPNRDMYFISEETGYLGCMQSDSIYLYKLTGDPYPGIPKKLFVSKYDSLSGYYSISDTIFDTAYYCGTLDHLFFTWYIDDDTIEYELLFVLDPTIGTVEENSVGIVIGPNPTYGPLRINLPSENKNITVEIYDILGHRIQSERFARAGSLYLEMTGKPGIYFMKVYVGNQLKCVQKILKQ